MKFYGIKAVNDADSWRDAHSFDRDGDSAPTAPALPTRSWWSSEQGRCS